MSLTLGRISFFTFWAKSLPKGRTAENTQGIGKSAEKAESRQRKENGKRLKSKEQDRGGAAENTQGYKAAESRQRKGNGRRLKSKEQDSGRVAEKAVRRRQAGKERKTADG